MSKYIDAKELITEIKDVISTVKNKNYPDPLGTLDQCLAAAEVNILELVLDIIDSIQQEMWKPSEKQITAVEAAYSVLNSHDTWGEDEHLPTLMSLINDLQKLL